MTKDQFEKISELKKEIEVYEDILKYRQEDQSIGFALPHYFSWTISPNLYRIKDKKLNKDIEKLVAERLSELKREFSDIQIM